MSNHSEYLCNLTDCLHPVPLREGGEEMLIYSTEQLVDTLREFATKKARVLVVSMPKGRPQLVIGMSGALGAVDVYPFFSTGRAWSAKKQVPSASEDFWITFEGELARFRAWAMMPVNDVIQIVAYLVEHNELPDAVEWVDPMGRRLHSLHENPDAPLPTRFITQPTASPPSPKAMSRSASST